MDAEISKATQRILQKQGIKFKLNTKVLSGDDSGDTIKLEAEAAKGGKKETVSFQGRNLGLKRLATLMLTVYSYLARRKCCSCSYRPAPLHRGSGPRKHRA